MLTHTVCTRHMTAGVFLCFNSCPTRLFTKPSQKFSYESHRETAATMSHGLATVSWEHLQKDTKKSRRMRARPREVTSEPHNYVRFSLPNGCFECQLSKSGPRKIKLWSWAGTEGERSVFSIPGALRDAGNYWAFVFLSDCPQVTVTYRLSSWHPSPHMNLDCTFLIWVSSIQFKRWYVCVYWGLRPPK